MRRDERSVIFVLIATGISSVAAQLYIVREFLTQFHGNEYVIAMTLFNWLVIGGVGTLAAYRITPRYVQASRKNLAFFSFVLALLPAIQIVAMRLGRDYYIIPGSSVGFYQTFFSTLLFSLPYCLVLGFILPFTLFLLQDENKVYKGARVYIADNLGDVAGGVLFSLVLIYFCTPMQAMLVAAVPLTASIIFLFSTKRHVVLSTVLAIAACSLLYVFTLIEQDTLKGAPGELVHYRETKYGRIEVRKDQEQYTVFTDGVPVASSENLEAAQEAVHFPLSQLEKYDSILFISALGGIFNEAVKYGPKRIDYVELNQELTEIFFSYDILERVPALNVVNMDGRKWLMDTAGVYDSVIVNLPEPDTFQVNRFYTDSFFRLVHDRLVPGGVFSFSVRGYDNYIDEPHRQKISSLYMTVSRHFKHVLLVPGQDVYFLCSDSPLKSDIPALLLEKRVEAPFVAYYFHGNVTPERMEYIRGMIDEGVPINYDFKPRMLRIMFDQWFEEYGSSPLYFQLFAALLLFIYLGKRTKPEFLLFSTGFAVMGCELLVIFVFQIFYGYIYTQLGIIVTVFLAGLMPGAILGQKLSGYGSRFLVLLDLLLMGLLLQFIMVLWWSDRPVQAWFLLAFSFLVSLACGCQFPAAFNLCGNDRKGASKAFSADLMGAAFGTLCTTILLLPYLGIISTAFVLVGLKSASFLMMVRMNESN